MRTAVTPDVCVVRAPEKNGYPTMRRSRTRLASHIVSTNVEIANRILFSNFQSVERIQYFHDAVQAVEGPLTDAQLAEMILKYVYCAHLLCEPQD